MQRFRSDMTGLNTARQIEKAWASLYRQKLAQESLRFFIT